MASPRLNCLLVLSSAKEGVSSASFIQSFSLTHVSFSVQIATPGGKMPEFILDGSDEQNKRWLNDFRMKSMSIPIHLSKVDANRYSCIIIPHATGAVVDLATDTELGLILNQFIKEKKPICAIGMGVAALFSAFQEDEKKEWSFKRYSLTCTTVFELARSADFLNLALVPEDVIKDNGGVYSHSVVDAVHVVIDRHLITGQNEQSTLTAVQNLILLCNQKHGMKGLSGK